MPVTGARKALSHLYRPQGPKLITSAPATPGTVQNIIQSVDLTVPIRGFRIVMKGRLVVGVAAFKDSLQLKFTFTPADTNATPQDLGTPAATTTLVFSSYGSGAGTPTIAIYSLPVILGDLRNSVLPGVIQRAIQPISSLVQSTANGIELLDRK